MQEFGGEVGAVGPLDGVASETILDELVAVEQLAEHLARQVGLQVAECLVGTSFLFTSLLMVDTHAPYYSHTRC